MVPNLEDIPLNTRIHLENLTMIEEMLISPILAIMSIYRLPEGALINRGFCANFTQDIQPLCHILPRLTKDLPILILKKKDQNNNIKSFKVNRERVETVLEYLCANNPAYLEHKISFDRSLSAQLPTDGIPQDFQEQTDPDNFNVDPLLLDLGPNLEENNKNNNLESDDEYQAFIENDNDEPLQVDNIKQAISFPKANKNAINEFKFNSICSLLFPKLFPTGFGDPTNKSKLFHYFC